MTDVFVMAISMCLYQRRTADRSNALVGNVGILFELEACLAGWMVSYISRARGASSSD
jgi:hypothetical protein